MNKEMFSKLNIKQIQGSLIASIPLYKQVVFENKDLEKVSEGGRLWCYIHDQLSWFYGYYGDLDLYFEDYELSLNENIMSMKSLSEFQDLVEQIAQAQKQQEEKMEQRKKDGWHIIEM